MTISATVSGAMTCSASSGSPNTGASQSGQREQRDQQEAEATEPTASTIIGTVMTDGGSSGAPSSHRGAPKKVISISRVM